MKSQKEQANKVKKDDNDSPKEDLCNTEVPQSPKVEAAKGLAAENDVTHTVNITKAKKNVSPKAPVKLAAVLTKKKEAPEKYDKGTAPGTEVAAPAKEQCKEEEEEDAASPPTGTKDLKEE